ncbi:MAG TPA: phosphatidylinositol mannoside acyltransferase [Streptosporangiaceae bacterium]|nr:phosphatidylinositol mannoside acyltransferase [Streptosporangiaceae bacterium]
MARLKDRLVSVGYGLGWSVLSRLPESVCLSVFRFFGEVAWRRQGPSVQVLEGNLRRVLGPAATGADVRAVSRESMRSYARYWLEVFRLPVMPVERLTGRMEDTTPGEVQAALDHLAAGRGVVFALPHAGNWDQAAAWIIAMGAGSITTVMERLKPESLFERFMKYREGLGMVVLPASGGDRPFGILARSLRSGKCVCLPCDRDITGHGIEVDFFGEKAHMAPGPAALAERTGAALMPVMLWFTEDGWGVKVGAEIPVPAGEDRRERIAAMTQSVASFFEGAIAEHPQDWHMLQRVFTGDLDQDRLAAAQRRVAAGG